MQQTTTVIDNDVAIKSTMWTEHIVEMGAEKDKVNHQFALDDVTVHVANTNHINKFGNEKYA